MFVSKVTWRGMRSVTWGVTVTHYRTVSPVGPQGFLFNLFLAFVTDKTLEGTVMPKGSTDAGTATWFGALRVLQFSRCSATHLGGCLSSLAVHIRPGLSLSLMPPTED